jgi:ABC-type transport system involved in cytochrome c biogenesis permease component
LAELFKCLRAEFTCELRGRRGPVTALVLPLVMAALGASISAPVYADTVFTLITYFAVLSSAPQVFERDVLRGNDSFVRVYADTRAVFAAKALYSIISAAASGVILAGGFVLFGGSEVNPGAVLRSALLTAPALAAAASFAAFATGVVGGRAMLLQIIAVPLTAPALFGAYAYISAVFNSRSSAHAGIFLLAFSVFSLLTGYLAAAASDHPLPRIKE